jgi:AraC-like DNA-binding protein
MRQNEPDTRFYYPPIRDREVRDGCYLTSMGHSLHPAGRRYPMPGHPAQYDFDARRGRILPDFALVLIARGEGFFENEREPEQAVHPGDFFCLTPGQWHRYEPTREAGWEEYWVCFNGDYPHRLQSNQELPAFPRLIRTAESSVLQRRLKQILEVLDSSSLTTTLGMGLRSLALFTEISSLARPLPLEPDEATAPSICQQAMAQIRENLHRMVELDDIADRLGVSRRTLERHFREEASISPGDFIIRSRVERARDLIESTDMPIKSITYACGFRSTQQMIYDFHRHLGMAPGRFRRTVG